jgi:hypothetical protein
MLAPQPYTIFKERRLIGVLLIVSITLHVLVNKCVPPLSVTFGLSFDSYHGFLDSLITLYVSS